MADARSGVNPGGNHSDLPSRTRPWRPEPREQPPMSMVRFDLPTPEGDTIEFWEATKEERLLIKHYCNEVSY